MAGRSTDISSARGARPVTASANPLPNGTCRGVYVATAGDITGVMPDGSTATFSSVAAGVLPVQFVVISACPASTLALY